MECTYEGQARQALGRLNTSYIWLKASLHSAFPISHLGSIDAGIKDFDWPY